MAVQYCNYDIKGTLAVTGTSTLQIQVHVTKLVEQLLISTPRIRLGTDGVIYWGANIFIAGSINLGFKFGFSLMTSFKGIKLGTGVQRFTL